MSFIPSLDSISIHTSTDIPSGASETVDLNPALEFVPPNDPFFDQNIMSNVDPSWEADAEASREIQPRELLHLQHSSHSTLQSSDDPLRTSDPLGQLNMSPHNNYQPPLEPDPTFGSGPIPLTAPPYASREVYTPEYLSYRSPHTSLSPELLGSVPYQETTPPLILSNQFRSLSSPPIDDETFGVYSPEYREYSLSRSPTARTSEIYPQYLATTPSNMSARTMTTPPPVKKLPYPCRDFINNCCTRGNRCKFMHVKPSAAIDKEVPICRDFIRGSCFRKNCKYLHERPRGILVDEPGESQIHRYPQMWEDPNVLPPGPMPPRYIPQPAYNLPPNTVPGAPLGIRVPNPPFESPTLSPVHTMYPPPPRRSISPMGVRPPAPGYVPPQTLHSPMSRSYNEPIYSRASSSLFMEDPYNAPPTVPDTIDMNPLTSLSPRPLANSASQSPPNLVGPAPVLSGSLDQDTYYIEPQSSETVPRLKQSSSAGNAPNESSI